jgi:hypothetical protein
MVAEVYKRRQQVLVPFLVPFVRRRTQILHLCIAFFHGIPQSRFLILVKKTHLASAVNTRLINAPYGIFR